VGPLSVITCLVMATLFITADHPSDTVVSNPPLGVGTFSFSCSGRVGSAVGKGANGVTQLCAQRPLCIMLYCLWLYVFKYI
jgi:hypothetical protein